MSNPKIAMTKTGDGFFHNFMMNKYVKCLESLGAEVTILPCEAGDEEALASSFDGFLFPGGDDVDPALYGAERDEKCGKVDEARDAFELPLLRAVLRGHKPVLCICRGAQLLNVALGGTLHQDIKELQVDNHQAYLHPKRGAHDVDLVPYTRLASILGEGSVRVNSLHHQAIDRVGDGLAVAARSADGFAEAVEIPGDRFCVAVQWHPEHMALHDARQMKIFAAFVEAAK